MSGQLSLLQLVTQASFVVQLIMLLLLGMSIASWTVIFQRQRDLSKVSNGVERFTQRFWSGVDLNQLYREVGSEPQQRGLSALFYAGLKEFSRLNQQRASEPAATLEGVQRAMRVALAKENDKLQAHVNFLATVASVSPYIGLFGTVWGIMNAFIALGGVQQATLSMVAPPIAEALIATAMGLFAAIPAVVAYNRLSTRIAKLSNDYHTFYDELSVILHRQIYGRAEPRQQP